MQQPPQQQPQSTKIKLLSSQLVHKKISLKKVKSSQQLHPPNSPFHIRKKNSHSSSSHKMTIHPIYRQQPQNIQLQSLEISDMLKTISHQKKILSNKRKNQLIHIHLQSQLSNDDYKHFMMVASLANYRKLEHPGYYEQLLKQIQHYPPQFFACIDKDIPRTMRTNHPLQQSLKNILYAYAIRNPSLLYCQGMNYLVSFLLINKFNQQQSFWFLVRLIEDILMTDYFKDLSTISITVQIFSDLIPEIFPKLFEQMQAVGMESGIFLVGWFICLFTKGFINSVSQYLLQQIILSSYQYPIGFILIKIAVSIFATLFTREQVFEFQEKDFKSLKQTIENSTYEISLSELKTGLCYYQYDYKSYSQLYQLYTKRRQKIYPEALEQQLRGKNLLPPCNINLPVCIHRVEIQKKIGTIEQVLILKTAIPIPKQLIFNYFPSNINKKQGKLIYENSQQCLITHHSHICNKQHPILQKQLTQQKHKYCPIECDSNSIEVQLKPSNIQNLYSSYSSRYFKNVNSNWNEEDNSLDQSHDNTMELSSDSQLGQLDKNVDQEKIQEVMNHTQNSGFLSSIGNVFKKALDGIKLLNSKNNESNQNSNNFFQQYDRLDEK